jgi:ribosomal protein S18 acetylase RimI-like enzyme
VHRRLNAIDAFLDAGPRGNARVEEIGPFTLFVSQGPWPYYARPRIGAGAVTAADVEAVRARQRALELPETFQWVHETAPSLRGLMPLPVIAVPLLILEDPPSPADGVRLLAADDPALPAALAVEQVGFRATGTAVGPEGHAERDAAEVSPEMLEAVAARIRAGASVTAVLEDDGPIAVGTLRPLGRTAEIVAVATLPAARRRGLAAAITAALVAHALAQGIETVFLSAADDDVARVYERLGFRRAATACFVL